MYNCSLAELKALNGDYSSLKVVKLFNTKDDELHFQMVIHNGELYYECVVDFGSELNKTNDFLLEIGEGNACLVLSWKVDNVEGSVDTTDPFKSYHLLTKEEYDANKDKYSGKYNDVVYKIGGKEYVIVYKTRNYFEYLIYTSSLGGEIMITFKDNTGKEYIKRCTKLSDSEKIELNNRNLNNVSTVNDLTRYIEKLENDQYTKFLEVQSEYNELSGYLSLGLECRIVLDLSIEQVD